MGSQGELKFPIGNLACIHYDYLVPVERAMAVSDTVARRLYVLRQALTFRLEARPRLSASSLVQGASISLCDAGGYNFPDSKP